MPEQVIDHFKDFLKKSLLQNASYKKKGARFIYPIKISEVNNASKNIFFKPEIQFLWKKPSESLFFHSLGRINLEKVFGFNQLIFSKETFNCLKVEIVTSEQLCTSGKLPLFCGNAQFAPFSNNSIWKDYSNIDWYMPKLTLFKDGNEAFLIYNFSLSTPENEILEEFIQFSTIFLPAGQNKKNGKLVLLNRFDLDETVWKNLVDNSLYEIKKKSFHKVVLSRIAECTFEGDFDLDLLSAISGKYPECITFLNKKGNSIFFGVTPERLLKISNGIIETESLAGSIKRSDSLEEDALLSERLLTSNKNLLEQQLVTDYIMTVLDKYTEDISFNGEPELVKLENIQHLKTKIKGKLKKDKFFFDLVNELQPTPAVCGFPKNEAFDFILQNEGYDRGLYSGITGWFNLDDEGEFAVAIRSALIKEQRLYAFTGCGIVEGSDAKSEFEETEIKLKPIFSIFEYENTNK
ncbi:MAG: hypothetical protein C0412_01190 [Flavobacterium sp.]|nr:hypothetical protein [Flavobacterium sp.]